MSVATQLAVTVEFGGGAELLFDKKKRYEVKLQGGEKFNMKCEHNLENNLYQSEVSEIEMVSCFESCSSVNSARNKGTLQKLLFWIRDNLLRERRELFLQNDTVRPGILVLINDADWELL
ncbi:hypothetical protein PV325_004837, partial [Microctonus aethiopoides]